MANFVSHYFPFITNYKIDKYTQIQVSQTRIPTYLSRIHPFLRHIAVDHLEIVNLLYTDKAVSTKQCQPEYQYFRSKILLVAIRVIRRAHGARYLLALRHQVP